MTNNLRQEYLITYDIVESKIRSKLFGELEKIGLKSIQKSVFWGYLSSAEVKGIERFCVDVIGVNDKLILTKTNFNLKGNSFYLGYNKEDFTDWDYCYVI